MIRRLKSLKDRARSGTTLVEMVVTLLIFSMLMASVVAVLRPATRIFVRMQKLQYAQVILDNTIRELQATVLEASGSGYVKIYADCGLEGAGEDQVTDLTDTSRGQGAAAGRALEFINLDEYVLLISADGFSPTHIYVGTTKINEEEKIEPGRLMIHYYACDSGNTYLYRENDTDGSKPIARAVTTVFADDSDSEEALEGLSGYYMGNYLELIFSYPESYTTTTDADGTEHQYYSYLQVTASLYDDPKRQSEDLVIKDTAVLDFRYPIERIDAVTAKAKPDASI